MLFDRLLRDFKDFLENDIFQASVNYASEIAETNYNKKR